MQIVLPVFMARNLTATGVEIKDNAPWLIAGVPQNAAP